jgi:hypothetical protein
VIELMYEHLDDCKHKACERRVNMFAGIKKYFCDAIEGDIYISRTICGNCNDCRDRCIVQKSMVSETKSAEHFSSKMVEKMGEVQGPGQ